MLTLPPAIAVLSIGYQPLGSCPRAAGWSAATLCTWPDSELAERPDDFRFLRYSGLVVLTASLSESDPLRTKQPRCLCARLSFAFLRNWGISGGSNCRHL